MGAITELENFWEVVCWWCVTFLCEIMMSVVLLCLFHLKVEVLASLQRPKKITVVASDGRAYVLLCKPKVS